jgi:cytochrome P450
MTTTPSCPVNESFDPLSPEFLADPYAVMAKLPQHSPPIFYAPSIGYYIVTRYAGIEAVFRDPAAYSAAVAQAPLVPIVPEAQRILLAGGHRPQPTMVSLDEPAHARLRKPTARAFSMKRVTAMIPTIEATTARLLDGVAGAAEFDLTATLAFPLPANIVFSLMGVPEQDYAQLKHWCGYRAALGWGRPAPEDQVEIATSMAAYRKYLRDLVDAKIRAPGDDVTSDLIVIHHEDPDRLTGRSRWAGWSFPQAPGSSCGWRPRAGTPPRSPSRMSSTCTAPTRTGTWRSARGCTIAWARTSANWKRRSPSLN